MAHNLNFPFGFAFTPPHTAFDDSLFVGDDNIFGFTLSQEEGQVATLDVTIKNPRIGLLNPGRQQWAWLSWEDTRGQAGAAGTIYPLFYGRLLSFPTAFNENAIVIRFPGDALGFPRAKASACS